MFGKLARLWHEIKQAAHDRQRGIVRRHESLRALRQTAWLKDEDDLDALIARTGYAACAEELHRAALPCIYLLDDGDAPDAPPGTTRFGGLPDLPPDTHWPAAPEGAPLSFLAQVALADLVRTTACPPLPTSGLLSFFAGGWDTEDGDFPIRVLLHPAGAELERRDRPVPVRDFDCPHTADLRPVAARRVPGLTFPEYDIEWMGQLEEEAPEGADYDAFQDGMSHPFPNLGQLLGHAPWTESDLRAEVFFNEAGRAGKERLLIWKSWEDWEGAKAMASELANGMIYRPWSSTDDSHMRWILDHRARIDAGIARWRFLFAVESGVATDLWVNDANAIYFFIPAEDLARADFSRVRAVVTQS